MKNEDTARRRKIRRLILNNDSHYIAKLHAYVKRTENATPYVCGSVSDVNPSATLILDMNDYNPELSFNQAEGDNLICDGDLLTAHVTVTASLQGPVIAEEWFEYSSSSDQSAVFELKGPLSHQEIVFLKIEKG